MSGSVRKKTRSRHAVSRQESARREPGKQKAQWSNQEYTAEEILEQFSLPQVVKCNQDIIHTEKSPVNFADSILLFEKRTIRKLLARNVIFDQNLKKYSETNETIVIPADYEGLFLRLNLRTCKGDSCFKSIEELAKHGVKAFVNLTKFTAFRIGQDETSNSYTKVDYTPGNVLFVEKICTGSSRVKKTVVQNSYLKCKDEKDVQILIPFQHPGEFSEVLIKNGNMSVTSEHLVAEQTFPILVRFISSKQKPRLKSFSGLFALIDSFEESTVIGCVLNPNGFTLFELPVNFPLSFHLALNNQDLYHHPVVKHALKLCEIKSKQYSRDMKYKSKFGHRIVQFSGRKISTPRDSDDMKSALDSARFEVSNTFVYI